MISNLRPSGHLLPKQALYQAEPRPALRIVRVLIGSGMPRNHRVAESGRSSPQRLELAQAYALAVLEIRNDNAAHSDIANQLEHATSSSGREPA